MERLATPAPHLEELDMLAFWGWLWLSAQPPARAPFRGRGGGSSLPSGAKAQKEIFGLS